jgi:sugar lactone lactonase YvrE
LTHLNTVKHDLIYTPHNVAPVSKNEFYVTNDHYSKNNEIVRSFEALARRPWSYVVFHSSITNTTEIVADGLIYPNGIASNWDKSKIYVSTTTGGELLVYDRKSNNKLHLSERVYIGICLDNVSVDENGEIYIAGSQKALAALAQLMDGSAQTPLFPAAVVKVSNNTNEDKFYGKKYSHKIIYEDNGNVLPAVTVAAVDGRRKVMLLGSFYSKGVGRCDFDDELL